MNEWPIEALAIHMIVTIFASVSAVFVGLSHPKGGIMFIIAPIVIALVFGLLLRLVERGQRKSKDENTRYFEELRGHNDTQ